MLCLVIAYRNIYKNYYWFGQTIIDRVVLTSGIKNSFRFEFEGEENLRAMVNLKKGGLLLSAHIGNWEIAGSSAATIRNRYAYRNV